MGGCPMYLFSRVRRINPAHARAALAVATEAATRASDIMGMPVGLWTPVFSSEINMVIWTATAEHISAFETGGDALAGSAEFMDWIEENDSMFQGSVDDSVLQIVSGSVTSDNQPAYATVTQAVAANGSVGDAMTIGVELAEVVERVTGLPMIFGSYLTGAYASVAWAAALSDLDTAEAANAAMAASDELRKLIDSAGHVYQPGVTQVMLRRLV